jgi:NADPH:quinone reductase-like Zn-dependent oxidoreductase
VIGVSSSKNHDFLRSLGAHHTLDYKEPDLPAKVRELVPEGVDLIYDSAGHEALVGSLPAAKEVGAMPPMLARSPGVK